MVVARTIGMQTTGIAGNYRWGWAGLLLAAAAAFSAGGEKAMSPVAAPEPALQQTSALESSRELLALHRLSDPSLFRCYLCRLEPALVRSANVRVNNVPAECEDRAATQRQL